MAGRGRGKVGESEARWGMTGGARLSAARALLRAWLAAGCGAGPRWRLGRAGKRERGRGWAARGRSWARSRLGAGVGGTGPQAVLGPEVVFSKIPAPSKVFSNFC